MVVLPVNFVILFFLLVRSTLASQVSPNSPCASVCLDNTNQNISGPEIIPDTFGTDIVCLDGDYSDTAAGRKYISCMSCLQTSTASSSGQTDQEWFLYNLRYTLDSCLFGFANVSDSISTPCSTSNSCGPLRAALEDGNLNPNNQSGYFYCSADSNSFLGSFLPRCTKCLRDSTNEQYLANFLVALQAGCDQLVPAGILIGIQGTVFSTVPVNITYPGYNQSTTKNKKLSQPAVIGISVGLSVIFVVALAALFVCYRRQKAIKRLRHYQSPLDSRFGAKNITAPTDGAYGNPYLSSLVKPTSFDPRNLTAKELTVLNEARTVIFKHNSSEDPHELKDPDEWQDVQAQLSGQLPPYLHNTIPTHQAYIPTSGVVSPASFRSTTTTAQPSPNYPSARSSPRNHPPPIIVPQPQNSPPPEIIPQPSEYQIAIDSSSQKSPPTLETRPPSRTASRVESLRNKTNFKSLGNANARQNNGTMPNVSGPIHKHEGRFDFEFAERVRGEKEARAWNKANPKSEPVSAESPEQWPGSY